MTNSQKIPFSMRSGWIVCIAVLGALMLVSGLLMMRFDMTVSGAGVVEAKAAHRIFSPRDAWLEHVEVRPGQDVRPGAPLLQLRDENLEREILSVREAMLGSRAEARRAELRLRELELSAGGVEAWRAPLALKYHARRAEVLDELRDIYQALSEKGSLSRVEMLGLERERVNARLEALRDETLLEYHQSGALKVLSEQQQWTREIAEARSELLQNRLDALHGEQARLKILSPSEGRVSDVYVRDPGMMVSRGQEILSVADLNGGYRVKLRVHDRNVDLIRPGQAVRMTSSVYPATAEGYMHGEVLKVITDPRSAESGGFEVWVGLNSWPVQPVVGSRVSAEIMLRKQSVFSLLVPRASRQNPRDPLQEAHTDGP